VSRIVAIGQATALAGYALAGVDVVEANDRDDVRRAWEQLGREVGLVLLTADARAALPDPIGRRDVLWVVLPA
jgi:vacuolar-type H+-ATPase subunit F/Vma7